MIERQNWFDWLLIGCELFSNSSFILFWAWLLLRFARHSTPNRIFTLIFTVLYLSKTFLSEIKRIKRLFYTIFELKVFYAIFELKFFFLQFSNWNYFIQFSNWNFYAIFEVKLVYAIFELIFFMQFLNCNFFVQYVNRNYFYAIFKLSQDFCHENSQKDLRQTKMFSKYALCPKELIFV